jgi:hypothetical protein
MMRFIDDHHVPPSSPELLQERRIPTFLLLENLLVYDVEPSRDLVSTVETLAANTGLFSQFLGGCSVVNDPHVSKEGASGMSLR